MVSFQEHNRVKTSPSPKKSATREAAARIEAASVKMVPSQSPLVIERDSSRKKNQYFLFNFDAASLEGDTIKKGGRQYMRESMPAGHSPA